MNALVSTVAATFALLSGASFLDAPVPQDPTLVLAAGKHDARELVGRFAKFLGRNVLYDDSLKSVPMEIELQTPMTLTRANCESVVEGLIWSKYVVLVPVNVDAGIWEVVNMQGPSRSKIQSNALSMSVTKVLENRGRKVPVQCALPLRHLKATAAMTTLRPFFTATGQVGGLTFGNVGTDDSLILQGFCDQVANAIDMLSELDVPPPGEADAAKGAATPIVRNQLEAIRAELSGLVKRVERLEGRK